MTKKNYRYLFISALICVCITIFLSCFGQKSNSQSKQSELLENERVLIEYCIVDTIKLSNGRKLLKISFSENVAFEMRDSVPLISILDSSVCFAASAAFTGDTERVGRNFVPGNICGSYVTNGKKRKGYAGGSISGWISMQGSEVSIGPKSELPSLKDVADNGGSLFQQTLLINDGTISKRPVQLGRNHIRRAACIMNDNTFAIIQSMQAYHTDEFVEDLLDANVRNALYLDMGGWNYGWYRKDSESSAVHLGRGNKYLTNYIVGIVRL